MFVSRIIKEVVMESNVCPVCGSNAKISSAEGYFAKYIECSKCNVFIIDNELLHGGAIEPKLGACMYFYITQNALRYKPEVGSSKNIFPHFRYNYKSEEKIYKHHHFIAEEDLYNLYPKTFSDRIDKIMLNLAYLTKEIGNEFSINYNDYNLIKNILFLENTNEVDIDIKFDNLFDMLKDMEFLKISEHPYDGNYNYKIASKGWERIEELEKENKIKNQGFVAMCFDKELDNARVAIKKAIKICGYDNVIIDEKQYNGQIVPEIFYQIKNSKFIIADLTEDRRGVYYEAGYGEALGKEVILTCRESDFKDIHFDVAQKSIIKWENEEDLEKRLIDRITATVGKIE